MSSNDLRLLKDCLTRLERYNQELKRITAYALQLEKEGSQLVIPKEKSELVHKRNMDLRIQIKQALKEDCQLFILQKSLNLSRDMKETSLANEKRQLLQK